MDLTWAEPNAFRVLHVDGDATNWAPVQPPDDLGCAYGKEAPFFWKWIPSAQDCPKLLPKWTFEPIAIYQFWIKPEDLQAGRFDKVELTSDAY